MYNLFNLGITVQHAVAFRKAQQP